MQEFWGHNNILQARGCFLRYISNLLLSYIHLQYFRVRYRSIDFPHIYVHFYEAEIYLFLLPVIPKCRQKNSLKCDDDCRKLKTIQLSYSNAN